MKKLGLIINPIAGMGGSVGLKGTDHMVETALLRGAVPRAGDRTQTALTELLPIKEHLEILTYPGAMGGDLAQSMGFTTTL
ncbi:MAG: ATP-NAD kinase, partial [Hungatella sp.]